MAETRLYQLKETIDDKQAKIGDRIHALLLLLRSRNGKEENPETEVATELIESEDRAVKNEANATMISEIVKEEPIAQLQVLVSKLEPSLRFHNASPDVCEDFRSLVGFDGLFDHEEAKLQDSYVKARAHQLFDKMSLRVRSKIRRSKCPKCWRFKFKNRDLRGYNLSRVKLLLKNSLVITGSWRWFMIVKGSEQCHMLEHANIEAESFPLLNFAAEQPFLWMQNSSEPILILSELERKKKKLCLKTWMFKYKNVEECIKRLYTQLRYNFRLENERCCERKSTKKCHSHVSVSELLQKSHRTGIVESLTLPLLINVACGKKYVSNNEVRSSFLNSLSDALIEAKFVKAMEEYSKNHLVSTLASELFHSPRPPELCVTERMIATKVDMEEDMNKDDQKQQGDWACYQVWHRWKARCFYVGMISTMRAWLFGEEGFDIGK